MPIPDCQSILVPLLRTHADGQEHRIRELYELLCFWDAIAFDEVRRHCGRASVRASPQRAFLCDERFERGLPRAQFHTEADRRLYDLPVIGVSNVGWLTDSPWKGRKAIGCSLAINNRGEILAAGPLANRPRS